MAGKKIELGPTGETVRTNIQRLRRARGLGFAELSRELDRLGRTIPPLGLRRIEDGERRVDVDDLVALAAALWVSPVLLLLPETYGEFEAEFTGLGLVNSGKARAWMRDEQMDPTASPDEVMERARFANRVKPRRIKDGDPSERQVAASRDLLEAVRRFAARAVSELDSGDAPTDDARLNAAMLTVLTDDTMWGSALDVAATDDERAEYERARVQLVEAYERHLGRQTDAT